MLLVRGINVKICFTLFNTLFSVFGVLLLSFLLLSESLFGFIDPHSQGPSAGGGS